jgi:protein involved in polysaccharide export with SLBB domain
MSKFFSPNAFKVLRYVSLLIVLICCTSIIKAQDVSITDEMAAHLFNTTSISRLNVDQLTDADIIKINDQLQSNGLSVTQAGRLAMAKGMPAAQWDKLKNRLLLLPANRNGQADIAATRSTDATNYLTYQKPPSSNVFGASFFNTASLSFEPNLRIATPVNYVLGPDDELNINVSGYQETTINATVQPEGTISIAQVGPINVNGLTISEATSRIRGRMSQTAYPSLKNNQSRLTVSLGKIRSIHITMVGAVKPGNYTISSLATVFNSLYQSGGPGSINTYRDIELIRNGKLFQKIDLYQFLTKGDQKGNVNLHEGDVINFPVYKKRVSITGQVKRNGVFELRDGETLSDLLFFAGGFTDKAYRASIKVKQITDIERRIKDISKAEIARYEPSNGDEFQVDSVLNRFENSVAIIGAVYRPGEFELTPGMTIKSLIERAGGLQENVFTDRAVLTRTYADGRKENITFNVGSLMQNGSGDIALVKRDSVTIATSSEFKSRYTVRIEGEVRRPGPYAYRENFSLKDILFLAGGFTNAASSYHIEVGRRIITDRTDRNIDTIANVFNIDTEKGLGIEDTRILLQPYDIVTVRRNPGYIVQQRVKIAGEINYPGGYTIQSKEEHVSDLVKRAGGLTAHAYTDGIFLVRNEVDTVQTHRQTVRMIQNSIKDTSAKVISDVTRNNIRIAIDWKKVSEKPGAIQDYVLKDGDSIYVSSRDPLVKISGEVLAATKTAYIDHKGLDYYLSQAGGTTEKARRSKIYVLYANGKIDRTNNGILGLFRSYPRVDLGAEVVVPKKQERHGLSTSETVGITTGFVSLISLIIVVISSLNK